MMNMERYKLSFGTGGLFRQESVCTAELFLSIKDWKKVRERIGTQNFFQCRTVNTSKRRSAEIITRLEKLSLDELDKLVHSHPDLQSFILWIAICRCYRFIADFALEVLGARYASLKTYVTYTEFDQFFEARAFLHPEIYEVSESTRKKIRQVLFKMMRETKIIDENNHIMPALSSPVMSQYFARDCIMFLPNIDMNYQSERNYVGY